MKIILLYPPTQYMIQGPIPGDVTNISGFPPLHLLSIAAQVEEIPNTEIIIVDCRLEKLDHNHLKEIISQHSPDLVGISVNTFMLIDALIASENIKKINKSIKVVLGGIHPTIYPCESIQYEHIDILILGEGEWSFKRLIEHLQNNKSIKDIPGVVSKNTKNPELVKPQIIEDLDLLKPPAWHLVNVNLYVREHKPVLWLLTSRGCVGKCTFCYIEENNRKFRYHSVDYIINELVRLIKRYHIHEFYIADDCFTVNKERVLKFCDEIMKMDIKLRWGAVSRVDTVNNEMLLKMSQAGCTNIYLGIESGDPKIQKVIKKNLNLDKVKDIIQTAQNLNMNPHGYVMIGHPSETKECLFNTITYIKSLALSGIAGGVAIFQPYPKTFSYIDGINKGIIKTDYWAQFAKKPDRNFKFQFWNEHFSNEELLFWQQKINFQFYFRLITVYRTLKEAIITKRVLSKIRSLFILLKLLSRQFYKKWFLTQN